MSAILSPPPPLYELKMSGLSNATYQDRSDRRLVVLWFTSQRTRDDFFTLLLEYGDLKSLKGRRIANTRYEIEATTVDPKSVYAITSVRQIIHFLSGAPFYKPHEKTILVHCSETQFFFTPTALLPDMDED